MRYFVRVVLGAVLGLVAVALLGYLGVRWWIGAAAGALLGAIGFLGSFFLWTADRPQEGYEQVLFDMPNNVVSLVLVVVMVGASFGAGALLHRGPSAPSITPEQAASMDGAHDNLTHIYNAMMSGNYTTSAAASDVDGQVVAIQTALKALPPTAKGDLLLAAADALHTALKGIDACKDAADCSLAARVAKADAARAKDPLDQYAA